MRRIRYICIVGAVMVCAVAGAQAVDVIIEDDFESATLDTGIWELRAAKGFDESEFAPGDGMDVTVRDGSLEIYHEMVEAGGAVVTRPIQPVSGKVLVIAKRTTLSPVGEKFVGQTAILAPDGTRVNGVCYWHMNLPGASGMQDGFVIGSKDMVAEEAQLPPVWDRPFDEVLIWDPGQEKLTYNTTGNRPVSTYSYGLRDSAFRVGFSAFALTSGDRHAIDGVKMYWTDPAGANRIAASPASAPDVSGPAAGSGSIPALDWPKPPGTNQSPPASERPTDVSISASTYGAYNRARLIDPVPFGAICLVARHEYGNVQSATPVTIQWRMDGQLVKTDEAQMTPEGQHLDSTLTTNAGPLPPGSYEVAYTGGESIIARGAIEVLAPDALGQRQASSVSDQALSRLRDAAGALDAGNIAGAAEKAAEVTPLLATLYFETQSAQAFAGHQLAESIIALKGLGDASDAGDDALAAEWAIESYVRAQLAQGTASDENLRAAAQYILDALESVFPQLKEI